MKQPTLVIVLIVFALVIGVAIGVNAGSLAQKLSGRILLQVQQKGAAWYVNPVDLKRYYLGGPADAFALLRQLGLGITDADLNTIPVAQNSQASLLAAQPAAKTYKVIKIIDGDTLVASINGKNETLRLIGLDTPETVDPRKPVQCFGREASSKAKELLTGQPVRLEAEPSQGERDKYNRLLRYLFLEDGTNYQDYMIRQGYAHEYTYNIPYKYQTQFKQAEDEARFAKRGLWADGACDVKNTETTPEPTAATAPTPPPSSNEPAKYDCSGNKYNCTNFKTQKEAQAAFDFCGGVKNDIHKLDSNKDGQACESLP